MEAAAFSLETMWLVLECCPVVALICQQHWCLQMEVVVVDGDDDNVVVAVGVADFHCLSNFATRPRDRRGCFLYRNRARNRK